MQLTGGDHTDGTFVVRSVLTNRLEFIEPTSPVYLFTAKAAAEFIVADGLKGKELHDKQVYVRTEHGLYVLEHFAQLNQAYRLLSADYFMGNRGIVLNRRAIRCTRQSSTVGIHVRDADGRVTIEWVKLSRNGLRKFKQQWWLKPAPSR